MKRVCQLLIALVIVGSLFALPSRKGLKVSEVPVIREPIGSIFSETEWFIDENWDDVTEIPAEWTVIDGDDDGYTWDIYDSNPHSAPNVAGSYYNADGNDDWLISSSFVVGTGTILDFWYASQDPSWLDAIEVLLSTTGNDPEDFTEELLVVAEVPSTWTHATLLLNEWIGDEVYIAFHNNSVDEFLLKVDDIKIGSLPEFDVRLLCSSALSRLNPTASFSPEVTIENAGGSDVSVDVLCQIYNGSDLVYEERYSVFDLGSLTSEDLTFPVFSDLTADEAYNVEFSVALVGDETLDDNEANYPMVTWFTHERMVMFQKFTAVGCGYCPLAAEGLRAVHDELGDDVIIASYHSTTSFGADPFYFAETVPFADAYGVSGYPTVVTSGFNPISGGYPAPGYGYSSYLAEYTTYSNYPTPYTIDVSVTSVSPTSCSFTTTCEQVAGMFPDSDPVLRYAVVRGSFDYSWGSSPAQTAIEHGVIAIPGGFTGYDVVGTIFEDVNSFDIGATWNIEDTYLIAFIQDNYSGEIYNAVQVPLTAVEEVFTFNFASGWNMISAPFSGIATSAFDHVLRVADIFGYNTSSGAYEPATTLVLGHGYWLLATDVFDLGLTEWTPSPSMTIVLVPGWNLIGGPNSRVSASLVTSLSEIIGPAYYYDVLSGGYLEAEFFDPKVGYWVLVSEAVEITLP